MRLTTTAKVFLSIVVLAVVAAVALHYRRPVDGTSLTPRAVSLPKVADVDVPTSAVPLPAAGAPGCPSGKRVRKLVWAWNAQMGEMFATGGKRATAGSLMCQLGVDYAIERQDDTGKMQAELLKFATALAAGDPQPQVGAYFVAIMGDGAAQFFAALSPQLAKLGPQYAAKMVGSAGYSRGEDKLMGPQSWKDDPRKALGGVVAGVLRDGDWNIAMQWQKQNDLCNHPDEKSYDPDCVNWVSADTYLDAAEKFVAGYCEDRKVVRRGKATGETRRVCVDAVVTWTPGDVNVAEKKGGLVSIVSTKQYPSQMPNVIIGIDAWTKANRGATEAVLEAIFRGGEQVKQHPAALQRAAEVSAEVYGEKDAAYWLRYYRGTVERDARGLTVDLGGSRANGLADNLVLLGLAPGTRCALADTYTEFGNLVVQQYPDIVPAFPPIGAVLDDSFVRAVAARNPTSLPTDAPPAFTQSEAPGPEVSRRAWHFEFDTNQSTFRPSALPELEALARAVSIASNTIVRVDGYTDRQGTAAANLALSEARAFAVRDYLVAAKFPSTRFRVAGHGWDNPVASNATVAGRAQNRRVEIAILDRQ